MRKPAYSWLAKGNHACMFSRVQTFCDPIDCSLPGSSVHGIFQARILKWVAISSSRGSSQPRDQTHVSCISCIEGGFFTTESPRKPQSCVSFPNSCESIYTFSSVQFSSFAQSCPTLCDPMNHSMPGLPVHHQLPEFTQTHVH